jgi:mannose-6-phosphate isomerase-like protein (cupin superfamily)
MKYKINQKDVLPDKSLRGEDGWNRMQVQWLCTKDNLGSKHAVLGRTVFPPNGASHENHVHENAEEILYVVSGRGKARVADEEFDIEAGDVVFIPVGAEHFFINTDSNEEMETIWLYGGVGTLKDSGYRPIK